MRSRIVNCSPDGFLRSHRKNDFPSSLEEPVDFDIRTEFLRDEGLSYEEEQLIADRVIELRRRLEPEITEEMEKSMDVQSKWLLYLGLCIVAAAACGIILNIAQRRRGRRNRRSGETRDKLQRETHQVTGLAESLDARSIRESMPSPNAFGVEFPSSPEWEGIREFLKTHRPANLRGTILYLDEQTIDGLRGYGHWKQAFVDALCNASDGRLEPIAPSVGAPFDLSSMERDEQLSGECKVTLLISPGLRETKTGKIVCKAFVSVC